MNIENIRDYITTHTEEAENLLRALGKIPAPSHFEDKRAEYVKNWYISIGADDVEIDEAKNVVVKIGCENAEKYIVFMAHTDVVFPDTDELLMYEEGRKLYAPGIGDDTANLINLMMGAKFIIENKLKSDYGFIIVANSCEEGLGNLKGSKQIFKDYGDKIEYFYSFDGSRPWCVKEAVGSYRYKITVKTEGGHSWANFGRANAIEVMSRLIAELYQMEIPTEGKTTLNVGRIEGGTTVNSIAQKSEMLFEFRSVSQICLQKMEAQMNKIINKYSEKYDIETELLGVRPGNGDIDTKALDEFTAKNSEIIKDTFGEGVNYSAGSTDANIPLSMGIIANTIGTIVGEGAHTREEWIDLNSIPKGIELVIRIMMQYML